ncbi:MAG: PorT family protein [Dysgonamonadaceae bacterium]|jgi:hypothetical protein|nr:PorT family protein [Dysgonamonadaceae bacterium]
MKRIALFLVLAGMISIHSANAQLAWGARVGLCYSTLSGDGAEFESAPAFEFGPTVYYSLGERTYFNSGLMYSIKRFSYEENYTHGYYKADIKLNYLELPLYVGYVIPAGNFSLYAQAGPYFGFKVSESAEWDFNSYMYPEDNSIGTSNSGANGFNAGLGIVGGVNINKFKIELGYQMGLTNVLSEEEFDSDYSGGATAKIGSLFAGISYVF